MIHPPRLFVVCGLILACAFRTEFAAAQYLTAPNNYYPQNYFGSTFTGKVVQATDASITLSYTHGSKTDIFVAHASSTCNLPTSKTTTAPTPLTAIELGTTVTALYNERTRKVSGLKEKDNQLIGLSFVDINGKKINGEHRAIFYCIPTPFYSVFKVFGGDPRS